MSDEPQEWEAGVTREERFISHALVEVKRFKWWPFGSRSAVLLDISLQGFKIEFTTDFHVQVGSIYWMSIPLTPLGIYSPTRLMCQAEVRWFDEAKFRVGGVFTDLDQTQRLIIDQVVGNFKGKGDSLQLVSYIWLYLL